MQVDILLPREFYDKFREMVPLLVVQEIPDCDIPEEMKVYKEKTGRKTVEGTKKLLGVMKAKKDFLQRFIIWLNTNQVSLFHGFQRRWQMSGVR